MKLGIMQPYFMSYNGYWQLLHAVDTFVVYDNIQYTKKGWINRNRFLSNSRYHGVALNPFIMNISIVRPFVPELAEFAEHLAQGLKPVL